MRGTKDMSDEKTISSKLFKSKAFKWVIAVILIVAVSGLGIRIFLYNDKESVSNEYINALLTESSELTTSKLNYTGMTEYHDKGIPIINKADFIMVYKATARAGIDIKDVKVNVDNDKRIVYLTIPKAEVLEVKVDPNEIKYFDEKFAILNVNPKEDANKAQALAEEAARKEISKMGILELADQQSETLIKGILSDAVPKDYKFVKKNQ